MGKPGPGRPGFLVKALEVIARKRSSKKMEDAAIREKASTKSHTHNWPHHVTASCGPLNPGGELHCLRSAFDSDPSEGVEQEELLRTAAARIPSNARIRRHDGTDTRAAPMPQTQLPCTVEDPHPAPEHSTTRRASVELLQPDSGAPPSAEWHTQLAIASSSPGRAISSDSSQTGQLTAHPPPPLLGSSTALIPNETTSPLALGAPRGLRSANSLQRSPAGGPAAAAASMEVGTPRVTPAVPGSLGAARAGLAAAKFLSLRYRKDINAWSLTNPMPTIVPSQAAAARPATPAATTTAKEASAVPSPVARQPANGPSGLQCMEQGSAAAGAAAALTAAPAIAPHPPTRPHSPDHQAHIQVHMHHCNDSAEGCVSDATGDIAGASAFPIGGRNTVMYTGTVHCAPAADGEDGARSQPTPWALASPEIQESIQANIHHLLLETSKRALVPAQTAFNGKLGTWATRRSSFDAACLASSPAGSATHGSPVLPAHSRRRSLVMPAEAAAAAATFNRGPTGSPSAAAHGRPAVSRFLSVRTYADSPQDLRVLQQHPTGKLSPAACGDHDHGTLSPATGVPSNRAAVFAAAATAADALAAAPTLQLCEQAGAPARPQQCGALSPPVDGPRVFGTMGSLRAVPGLTATPASRRSSDAAELLPVGYAAARCSLNSAQALMAAPRCSASARRLSSHVGYEVLASPGATFDRNGGWRAGPRPGAAPDSGAGVPHEAAGFRDAPHALERHNLVRESLPKRDAELLQLLDEEREDMERVCARSRQAVRTMSTCRRASLEVSTMEHILTVDWKKYSHI